ncbi:MAG: carbohydrate ABC transporter permease, partial [Chloroflexi bacterium]|nr:carbohydrate ABC transporter permease [Chloroflexota bacterium]
ALTHLVLVLGSLVMIFPVLWMVSTSFKPPNEVLSWPPTLLPQSPTLANYGTVFDAIPIVRFFLNSVLISLVSTAFVVATSLVAGYVFAKFAFPGRDILFFLILITAIVPFESYMTPLYLQMVQVKWINTYQGMIAPYAVMSFGVLLMRQHMRSAIPDELIDAARIDGASEWRIFAEIVVALSLPAAGALGIFAFIQAWAAFLWPLLVANQRDLFNLELGVNAFQFRFSVDYGPLMAGSVLSVLPMVIAFLLFRRQIIESAAISGLKG